MKKLRNAFFAVLGLFMLCVLVVLLLPILFLSWITRNEVA